jgi:disulfide bond formation protein DsbB
MQLNPFRWSFRTQYFAGFIACVAMMAYAYYVQFDLGIEPCTWCIFQRLAVIAIGLTFLIGALHNPNSLGRRVYALLALCGACAGMAMAGHHIWLQHQPPDPLAGCVPGWNYWVENYSLEYAWSKTIQQAFVGHADCAEVNWTFLGLAMPFWTLVSFAVLGISAVWTGFRKR